MANDFVQQPENWQTPAERIRWLAAYNAGTASPAERLHCPSFGICMVGPTLSRNGQLIRSVSIPYDNSLGTASPRMSTGSASASTPWILTGSDPEMRMPYKFAVNSQAAMAKSPSAKVTGRVTQDWPAQVLCDFTDDAPSVGEVVGPTHKSWYVSTEGKGFVCESIDPGTAVIVNRRRVHTIWIGPSGGSFRPVTAGLQGSTSSLFGGNEATVESGAIVPTSQTPAFSEIEYLPANVPTSVGSTIGQSSQSAAWYWLDHKLTARRDTIVFMSANCRLRSTSAPDGALLMLRLIKEAANGSQSGHSSMYGSRMQSFTFRSSDSDGDYFPQFFSSENVAFSSLVLLEEGCSYYLANVSAYSVQVADCILNVFEVPRYQL